MLIHCPDCNALIELRRGITVCNQCDTRLVSRDGQSVVNTEIVTTYSDSDEIVNNTFVLVTNERVIVGPDYGSKFSPNQVDRTPIFRPASQFIPGEEWFD